MNTYQTIHNRESQDLNVHRRWNVKSITSASHDLVCLTRGEIEKIHPSDVRQENGFQSSAFNTRSEAERIVSGTELYCGLLATQRHLCLQCVSSDYKISTGNYSQHDRRFSLKDLWLHNWLKFLDFMRAQNIRKSLSQSANPMYTFSLHFFRIHVNIILQCSHTSQDWYTSLTLGKQQSWKFSRKNN